MTAVCAPDLDFVLRPGAHLPTVGDGSAEVLEVHLAFGDTLLQTSHLRDGDRQVSPTLPDPGWGRALMHGFSPAALAVPIDDDLPRFLRTVEGWFVVDGDQRVAVADGAAVTVQRGDLTWVARRVPAARAVPRRLRVDHFFLGLLGLSTFAALGLAAVATLWPKPPEADLHDFAERMGSVMQLQLVRPPEPTPQAKAAPGTNAPKAARSAPRDEGRTRKGDTARARGSERARADREVAMNAGVMGWLTENGAESGFGGADPGLRDALARGTWGRKGGDPTGTGFGKRGDGLGGPGEVGEWSGGGSDSATCDPGKTCRRLSAFGVGWGKSEGKIKTDAPPVVVGGLPREAVDRVIKQNINAIRYCYQRRVQVEPHLQGKVVSRFVIAGDGSVSESNIKSTSLADQAVETCVAERIARLRFPEPMGGGAVIVSYPFVFAAGP